MSGPGPWTSPGGPVAGGPGPGAPVPPAPPPPAAGGQAPALDPVWQQPGQQPAANGYVGYSDQTFAAPGWSRDQLSSLVPEVPTPVRLDALTIPALVCAVLAPPVGVVLGVVSLVRTLRTARPRTLWPIVAVVLGLVASAVVVVMAVSGTWGRLAGMTDPLEGPVSAPEKVHVRQLVAGVCLADVPAGDVTTVTAVPCDGPHAAQVASQYAFAADTQWPGREAAQALVARSCTLTQAEHDAGTRALALSPTERSWSQSDRTGLCVLVPAR